MSPGEEKCPQLRTNERGDAKILTFNTFKTNTNQPDKHQLPKVQIKTIANHEIYQEKIPSTLN